MKIAVFKMVGMSKPKSVTLETQTGELIASAADGYHQRSDKIWSSDSIAKLAVEGANALIDALNKEATHE